MVRRRRHGERLGDGLGELLRAPLQHCCGFPQLGEDVLLGLLGVGLLSYVFLLVGLGGAAGGVLQVEGGGVDEGVVRRQGPLTG